jgi:hypothetical protein
VLSALRDHPHADVSHQGVCDLLHARTAATPMRRFQPTGHEARLGDNRHRVVGRSCGAIADVDRAVGYTACMPAADDLSHEIDEAEVIYRAVRRLIADMQRSTPAKQYSLGSRPANVKSNQPSEGKKDRRV